ncbi:hypothetical protein [Flagellimonas nanhaiensis]|nr:hypothetical protein [Allomuricauda nanhaiensis]
MKSPTGLTIVHVPKPTGEVEVRVFTQSERQARFECYVDLTVAQILGHV